MPDGERTVVISHGRLMGLEPGEVLGHTYQIEQLIARGGMGEVYRATHIELKTEHAIKLILPNLANDPKMVQLLIEEARKLSRLRNDAIVSYEGLFRDERGMHYLVMEFVEGESLASILTGRRLEPPEVLRLRDRLASGLAAAHEKGIIHRDISPDNILLPQGDVDRAKMIDFGIAKSLDTEGTLIGTDFAGRYAYASPEQAGLFGGRVDLRSDIYSLGLVLATAAIGFGKKLDMGASPTTMIAARQKVPDLSAVPAQLRPVIAPMLEPRPEDRPGSMRALLPAAPEPSSPAPSRVPVKPIAIGATALVVAVIALVFVFRASIWPPAAKEIRKQVEEVIAGYGCAALDYSVTSDRSVRISGHAATAEDIERLRGAVANVYGVGKVSFDVGVMPWPYCEVVSLLQPLSAQPPQDLPRLALAAKEAHTGERLAIDVRAPSFDGYLYIDYFVSEGKVLHLLPNGRDQLNLKPARNHFVLGKQTQTCWTLGGGTGEQLVTLIAAKKPLFPERRPEVEDARDYLTTLSGASLAERRPISAATLFFELRNPPFLDPSAACPTG